MASNCSGLYQMKPLGLTLMKIADHLVVDVAVADQALVPLLGHGILVDHVLERQHVATAGELGHGAGTGQAGHVRRVAALEAGREGRVDVAGGLVVDSHARALDPRGDDRLEGLLLRVRPDGEDVDLAAETGIVSGRRGRAGGLGRRDVGVGGLPGRRPGRRGCCPGCPGSGCSRGSRARNAASISAGILSDASYRTVSASFRISANLMDVSSGYVIERDSGVARDGTAARRPDALRLGCHEIAHQRRCLRGVVEHAHQVGRGRDRR